MTDMGNVGHELPTTSAQGDAFDHVARKAGAELRKQAPPNGMRKLADRRRAQIRTRTTVAGGVAAVLVVAGLAVRAARNEPNHPVVEPRHATTTATTVDLVDPSDTGRASPGSDGPDPVADAGRDAAIREKALFPAERLGLGWTVAEPAPDSAPDISARLEAQPACGAFRTPEVLALLRAPETERDFTSLNSQFLFQDVSVFPTHAVATTAMDLLADPNWIRCSFAVNDAEAMRTQPGTTVRTTGLRIAPPASHGDRQVSYGSDSAFSNGAQSTTRVQLVVAVQVGRAVVIVNPAPDHDDNTDPTGFVNKVVTAATDSLTAALAAG